MRNRTLSFDNLTTEEKIEIMETLWEDLSKNADNISVPSWHEKILRKRDDAFTNGEEEFMDWKEAKKLIKNNFQ